MRKRWLSGALKLGDNAISQHLAQFNAPLVERIDVPDGALHENFVLVERDEPAQRIRRQAFHQDNVGRAIPLEGTMWHLEGRDAIGCDLLLRLPKCQRLRLREEIRHEHIMVLAQRIQRLAEADEVTGDQLRALVNKLEEGVLAVGAGLAPDDRTGLVIYALALQIDVFAVALHVELLEVSGQAPEVVVVGYDRHGLGTEEVIVPDA